MFPTAKVLAHSRPTWAGDEKNFDLISLQLQYPRFIHSEFMTHRMFSRNASSSRAVPTQKLLDRVVNDPIIPAQWGKNQPGMQAKETLAKDDAYQAEICWRDTGTFVAEQAEWLLDTYEVHKQVVNRMLEPWLPINVVVTSTEWNNFFSLRISEHAQPEMRDLALAMAQAIHASVPRILDPGEWHLPYYVDDYGTVLKDPGPNWEGIKHSVARCARVSYNPFNEDRPSSFEEDEKLYNMLYNLRHASPFEHQAKCIEKVKGITDGIEVLKEEQGINLLDSNWTVWSNNFRQWVQYRAYIAEMTAGL